MCVLDGANRAFLSEPSAGDGNFAKSEDEFWMKVAYITDFIYMTISRGQVG